MRRDSRFRGNGIKVRTRIINYAQGRNARAIINYRTRVRGAHERTWGNYGARVQLNLWIPACAGMTAGSAENGDFAEFFQKRSRRRARAH